MVLCGGFFCPVKSPGKLLEDVDHLLVRNLAETPVIKTDGAEKLEADNVIGLAAQLVECACRCYRRGQNQFFGIACTGSAQGRPHRRTGRDLDHDRRAAADLKARLGAQIALAPPLYLGKLIVTDRFERGFVDVRKPDHFLIRNKNGMQPTTTAPMANSG